MPFSQGQRVYKCYYCKPQAMNTIDQDFSLNDLIGRTLCNPNEGFKAGWTTSACMIGPFPKDKIRRPYLNRRQTGPFLSHSICNTISPSHQYFNYHTPSMNKVSHMNSPRCGMHGILRAFICSLSLILQRGGWGQGCGKGKG